MSSMSAYTKRNGVFLSIIWKRYNVLVYVGTCFHSDQPPQLQVHYWLGIDCEAKIGSIFIPEGIKTATRIGFGELSVPDSEIGSNFKGFTQDLISSPSLATTSWAEATLRACGQPFTGIWFSPWKIVGN